MNYGDYSQVISQAYALYLFALFWLLFR